MKFTRELQRYKRLWFPKANDHAAWLVMEDVGRWWLLLHGWKREYRLWTRRGWVIVDLAHPKLKLALEGDGFQYHMDIVREVERDEALTKRGWTIRHYRYQRLKYQPRQVKREVRTWYWHAMLWNTRK